MVKPQDIVRAIEGVIVGKRDRIELVLAALLAEGHVLIEDVPGVAKTMLARCLARTLQLSNSRVQMTPDLLPADLTGTGIWDERSREFRFQPGPIFAQIVLADELNRATPRAQSGLLEAMEERAVTVDGARHALPEPFFVIATQNPLEQHGVFPLPEAQLDRFLIQIDMGYPGQDEEIAIVMAQERGRPIDALAAVAAEGDVATMRREAMELHTDPSIFNYIVRLVRATRAREDVHLGASPRGAIGLHRMARALAYVEGASFVTPDHVKRAAPAVLRHRLMLTPRARLSGVKPDAAIAAILKETEPPLYTGE